MKRRYLLALLTGLLISICFVLPVLAQEEQQGTWQEEDDGWRYLYEDLTFPKNIWMEIDGSWYYFDNMGTASTGWKKIGGEYYCFESDGRLAQGWWYNDDDENWYYFDDDGSKHSGWLYDAGSWYWFNSRGQSQKEGYKTIDGARYYFFDNGQMAANQYIGLNYMDDNGQRDETYDILIEGKSGKISAEEREGITEALENIPRSWIKYFIDHKWRFMYYSDRDYFSAPDTGDEAYYLYHKLDTSYRKIKFTDPQSLTRAFGEYIGYASGCYEEDSEYAIDLGMGQRSVSDLVDIPSYFDNDSQFYFGRLCEVFLDTGTNAELKEADPRVYQIINEILHLKDSEMAEEISEEIS